MDGYGGYDGFGGFDGSRGFSMRTWQGEQLRSDMRVDRSHLGIDHYTSPYPGVIDSYVIADLAQAPEATGASDTFTLNLARGSGPFAGDFLPEGAANLYQMRVSGIVWIPEVSGATAWGEYWILAKGAGNHFRSFPRGDPPITQLYVGESGNTGLGSSRSRIVPFANSTTAPRPYSLAEMEFSLASPAGKITLPQMRYDNITITYDGANASIPLGAGNGVLAGDYLIFNKGGLLGDNPHGAEVTTGSADTVEVASTRPAGTETGVSVQVAHRTVRIPIHLRSLVGRETNFTGP